MNTKCSTSVAPRVLDVIDVMSPVEFWEWVCWGTFPSITSVRKENRKRKKTEQKKQKRGRETRRRGFFAWLTFIRVSWQLASRLTAEGSKNREGKRGCNRWQMVKIFPGKSSQSTKMQNLNEMTRTPKVTWDKKKNTRYPLQPSQNGTLGFTYKCMWIPLIVLHLWPFPPRESRPPTKQWTLLAPEISGRYFVITQLAVYH